MPIFKHRSGGGGGVTVEWIATTRVTIPVPPKSKYAVDSSPFTTASSLTNVTINPGQRLKVKYASTTANV